MTLSDRVAAPDRRKTPSLMDNGQRYSLHRNHDDLLLGYADDPTPAHSGCHWKDWDGEDALPYSPRSFAHARRLWVDHPSCRSFYGEEWPFSIVVKLSAGGMPAQRAAALRARGL